MGYYIRFLLEDDRPLSLEEIMAGLSAADPGFALTGGDLTRSGELIAQPDISLPGSGVFEDDIGLFREQAGSADETEVAARLGSVTVILAARVLWQGRPAEKTLDQMGPLWGWLTASRRGLVHADDEGELILQTGLRRQVTADPALTVARQFSKNGACQWRP